MSTRTKVAQQSDITPGTCKTVLANGNEIAVYNVDGTYYATGNTCPHRGGPLGEGTLDGKIVTCPWHGWSFDVCSGTSPTHGSVTLTTYPVHIEGSDILVEI